MKCPDWRDRLHAYLDRVADRPFSWSEHNCLEFATGAVAAMTGIDWWGDERRKIAGLRTRSSILQYMAEYGGDLKGAADRALSKAQAQQKAIPIEGDIILAEMDGRTMMGVCLGRLTAFLAPTEITYKKPKNIIAVWGI